MLPPVDPKCQELIGIQHSIPFPLCCVVCCSSPKVSALNQNSAVNSSLPPPPPPPPLPFHLPHRDVAKYQHQVYMQHWIYSILLCGPFMWSQSMSIKFQSIFRFLYSAMQSVGQLDSEKITRIGPSVWKQLGSGSPLPTLPPFPLPTLSILYYSGSPGKFIFDTLYFKILILGHVLL